MAVVIGVDPWRSLTAEPFEELGLREVIKQASELDQQRKAEEIKAIGAAVAHYVAKLFA